MQTTVTRIKSDQIIMKTPLTVLAFLQWHVFTGQQTHGQSCMEAGYSSCCIDSNAKCSVEGRRDTQCYCDRNCYIQDDCCADIDLTCPGITNTTGKTNVDTTIAPGSLSPTRAKATSKSVTVTVLYPADTDSEQGIIIDTDSSPSTIAEKSSQAVTLREAVAWALLSLMTLLFIGTLSMVTIILLCIQKHRQKGDSTVTAEAPAYEMDGNPCYESSKIDTTYEPIETESAHVQYL